MRLLKTPEEVAATDAFGRGPEAFVRWTGPKLTDDLVRRAEAALGVRLPAAYLDLLRTQNGGFLRRGVFGDEFDIEFSVSGIAGIGYPYGIDSDAPSGGRFMCREWGYPDGLVYLDGDGHTAVMLDYRASGPAGPPSVVWLDSEDGEGEGDGIGTRQIASDFEAFLQMISSLPDPRETE